MARRHCGAGARGIILSGFFDSMPLDTRSATQTQARTTTALAIVGLILAAAIGLYSYRHGTNGLPGGDVALRSAARGDVAPVDAAGAPDGK